jgi:hypothetical protein
MMWVKKVLAPVALVVGLGVAAIGFAQPADGDDEQDPQPGQKKGFEKKLFDRKGGFPGFEKKAEPKADPQPQPEPRRGGQPNPGGRGERGDPAVDAWVGVLIGKITDPHDTIRDSARGALVGVGRPALPALQRLADGDDGAKAVAAKKVIAMIEHTSGRGPMAGPPMGGRGGDGGRGGEGDRGRGGEGDRGPGRPGFPGAGGPPGFGPGGPGFPGGLSGNPGGFPGGPPGFGPGTPGGPMGPGATPGAPGGRGGPPGAGPMGPGGRPGAGPMDSGARPGPGSGGPDQPPMPPGRPGGRGPGEGTAEIPPGRPA